MAQPYKQVTLPGTSTPNPGIILRVADNAFIPADDKNKDWQAYQAWLAAGNTPDAPA